MVARPDVIEPPRQSSRRRGRSSTCRKPVRARSLNDARQRGGIASRSEPQNDASPIRHPAPDFADPRRSLIGSVAQKSRHAHAARRCQKRPRLPGPEHAQSGIALLPGRTGWFRVVVSGAPESADRIPHLCMSEGPYRPGHGRADNGGYLRGRTKTRIAPRNGLPFGLCPMSAEFHLPTGHVSVAAGAAREGRTPNILGSSRGHCGRGGQAGRRDGREPWPGQRLAAAIGGWLGPVMAQLPCHRVRIARRVRAGAGVLGWRSGRGGARRRTVPAVRSPDAG